MPSNGGPRRLSENSSSSVDVLNSNRPQRLSLASKRSSNTDPSLHTPAPAPLVHPTSTPAVAVGPSPCGSGRAARNADGPRSFSASARAGAVRRASVRQPSSRQTEAATLVRTNTAASLTNTTTTTTTFPSARVRPSSAATSTPAPPRGSAAPATSRLSSSITAASHGVPRFAQPTASSRAHLSAPPPEAQANDTASVPPPSSETPSAEPAFAADAPTSTSVVGGSERQTRDGGAGAGLVRRGRSRFVDVVSPVERGTTEAAAWPLARNSLSSRSDVDVAASPPFQLGVDAGPSRARLYRVADPAPHIDGGKRRSRTTRESSVASTAGEAVVAGPSVASRSPAELLASSASIGDDGRSASVLSYASSQQPQLRPAPQVHQHALHARSLSQSTTGHPSAPQTPRRPVIAAVAKDRRTSVLDNSLGDVEHHAASSTADVVSSSLVSSAPMVALPAHNGATVPHVTLSHVPRRISSSPFPPLAFAPPTPPTAPISSREHPPPTVTAARSESVASAHQDAPGSAAAAAAAGARSSTSPQQRRSSSVQTVEDSPLTPRLLSAAVTPLQPDAVTSAADPSRAKRTSGAAAVVGLSLRSLSTPRSPPTHPAAGDAAANTGVRRSPVAPAQLRLPEPRFAAAVAAAESGVWEKAPSSRRSGSRSPVPERLVALLEDLQVLRQREDEKSRTGELSSCSLASHATPRTGQWGSAPAAVPTLENEDDDTTFVYPGGGGGGDDGDSGSHVHDEDDDDDDEAAVEEEAEEARQVMGGSMGGELRATDTTGHAPITPRLRRRIEQEQKRELEMLRTITKERHPENVNLLDSPETLMRELGRIDAEEAEEMEEMEEAESVRGDGGATASDEVEAEEERGHRRWRETAEEEEEEEAATAAAAALPLTQGLRRKPPSVAPSSSCSSPSTSVGRGVRVRPDGKPPVREAGGASGAAAAERPRSTASTTRHRGPGGSAAPSPSSRMREARTAAPRSSRHTDSAGTGSVCNSETSASNTTPRGRVGGDSGGGGAAAAAGVKYARICSRGSLGTAPSSASSTGGAGAVVAAAAAAAGGGAGAVHTPTAVPPASGRDTHRRPGSAKAVSGATVSTGSSTPLKGPTSGASDDLLPALLSAKEAANTVTIVFDLDETLCNNRCLAGPILRPGAELLLHTLRGLCPSPRYKFIDSSLRGQHASSRLYDEAMFRMGVTPQYRPRVAQRQSVNGYHPQHAGAALVADAGGTPGTGTSTGLCGTGEARPATAKDTNPLRLELVLWTASEEGLARRAMRRLDPLNKIFDEAIYRDARWYRDSFYTKDLTRLGRNVNRVVIVENSIDSVILNRTHAILVASFVSNRLDRQLFLVREVLRDWVRGMRAVLAEEQYAARCASAAQEGTGGASRGASEDPLCHRLAESLEEGGESPVPPHSTPSRGGSGDGVTAALGHRNAHDMATAPPRRSTTPDPAMPAPCPSSAASESSSPPLVAPRPLSAMARRAPNIAEYLQHHQLILRESNFLRFQLTADVMARLQATEPAAIAAALPPAPATAEQPEGRTSRPSSGGAASRHTRPTRAPSPTALSTAAPPLAAPAAAAAAAPAGGALTTVAPRTPRSAVAARPSSGAATGSTDGGATPAATRPRAAVKEEAPVTRPSSSSAASGSAVRAGRQKRPNSATAAGSDVARSTDADGAQTRPHRSTSATVKRSVANKT